jgi:hypothetical protein
MYEPEYAMTQYYTKQVYLQYKHANMLYEFRPKRSKKNL